MKYSFGLCLTGQFFRLGRIHQETGTVITGSCVTLNPVSGGMETVNLAWPSFHGKVGAVNIGDGFDHL